MHSIHQRPLCQRRKRTTQPTDIETTLVFLPTTNGSSLKKVMVKAGIIRLGHYRSKTASRIYYLTKDTMQELDQQRKPQRGELAG